MDDVQINEVKNYINYSDDSSAASHVINNVEEENMSLPASPP